MSDSPSQNISANQEILGYLLRERIGAGGYGEVWSAEAPGGMLKAVKFIYGFHDENRAQRELKALDRIKHIRHPFLLSLERIDVVDGRMVVISELADMCLKTRFNQCREQGLEAIPREELLQYMREAGDALDYIAENHSLAHLDVKPENLLIVGGHVKVADFGLVKELHATNQSLMDGLTPSYAAPELFDGRPGRASDQYSLAIVYQELLTATRPFSGTTAAQLANQHLHSWPNLNSLPRSDQAVIARALAKDPDKRYPNCRTLVEELTKRRNRSRNVKRDSDTSALDSLQTSAQTDVDMNVQGFKQDGMTMTISESFMPAIKYEGEIEKLEPLELDESEACIRPTLFIGVGNTGTRILGRLRQRLVTRYGEPDRTPALRFLCIDVDRKSLFEATLGNEQESMRNHELVNIPLRKPEDYRNDSELNLSWIGRRWIYNIPKSQLTESLRPLGRLAFVDHHEKIYQRLLDELNHLSRAEHLATTAESTGLSPSHLTPQVILVASVSGGTGSGLLLDLAFSVRIAMGELGLADDHLFGLFAHSTSRHAGDHRLAIANSYSFLGELNHFNVYGYPGSEDCGIPEFDNQTPVFDGTYFVHWGDDLQPVEYERSVDSMAHYLFLSTATRCTSFFEPCRDPADFDPGALKTMGIWSSGQGRTPISLAPSLALADQLLDQWLGSAKVDPPDIDIPGRARQMLAMTELDDDRLEARIRSMLAEHFDGAPQQRLLNHVRDQLKQSVQQGSRNVPGAADKLLDRRLGSPDDSRLSSDNNTPPTACEICNARLPGMARRNRDDLSTAILALIDEPDMRLHGARGVTEDILEQLQLMSVSIDARRNRFEQVISNCQEQYRQILDARNQEDRENACWAVLAELVTARVGLLVETYKRLQIQRARSAVASLLGQIGEYYRVIEMIRQQLSLPSEVEMTGEESYPDEQETDLHQLLEERAAEMARGLLPALEERIVSQFLKPEGGLQLVLREGGSRVRRMPSVIHGEAQRLVNQSLQELRFDSVLGQADVSADRVATWLDDVARVATPQLASCGGNSRLLIAVPQRAPVTSIASFIQHQMDHSANIVPATCGELAVCIEMDQIPTEHVAMSILQMQPDCAELINRLHARNDVQWSSLTPLC